jgi:hypothetical protein
MMLNAKRALLNDEAEKNTSGATRVRHASRKQHTKITAMNAHCKPNQIQ